MSWLNKRKSWVCTKMSFVVLLDANVLFPFTLRDFLVTLATTELYQAKWTDQIHDEWTRNLLKDRPKLADALPKTRALMNSAVPDCLVTGYEDLIESLELPDPDDRHVLAAAIRCAAQVIVTKNLKDFPSEVLDRFGITAQHPDEFLAHQFALRPSLLIRAAKEQRARWRNPPLTAEEYLDRLSAQGLVVTAEKLAAYADLF
jgi:predicted nucleic acid-binding protein